MRIRPSRARALLVLLPALHVVVASSIGIDTHDAPAAHAVAPAYTKLASLPESSPLSSTPASKGTKDAPVDGMDGKPHAGPYVDKKPTPQEKQSNVVEDLGKKPTGQSTGSILVGADDEVLDGDKSVMQDPSRKLATGSKGTEGGVSAKDKERLAHEEKTGEKKENVPESPKEAPPQPHDQKQLMSATTDTETSSRVLGAGGLEVPTETNQSPRHAS
ncbi:predicted protein [Plenodomus lingam JN3]|uniref:Predicted protein n=1 Tax=Leptosphaeria maculans (strain JN3 / isolate v23.1.3 / race Av1-4-5-6-7-8) TaxID=985895 RepID=E4ZHX6_LEPMJ|nr:predicted protein [Plenodomus lingam JN3]CBX91119.1 predicted protein [Plenodomus lingam JN3]